MVLGINLFVVSAWTQSEALDGGGL